MARIDVEIEDYLDEVATKYLVQELQKRKDLKDYNVSFGLPSLVVSDNSNKVLKEIKKLLGLREWHDKERIISEIEML